MDKFWVKECEVIRWHFKNESLRCPFNWSFSLSRANNRSPSERFIVSLLLKVSRSLFFPSNYWLHSFMFDKHVWNLAVNRAIVIYWLSPLPCSRLLCARNVLWKDVNHKLSSEGKETLFSRICFCYVNAAHKMLMKQSANDLPWKLSLLKPYKCLFLRILMFIDQSSLISSLFYAKAENKSQQVGLLDGGASREKASLHLNEKDCEVLYQKIHSLMNQERYCRKTFRQESLK